jgi:DNA-binding transcriptional MerR regulator
MAARTVRDTAGLLSIGQLARAAGVTSRTIRYYEELGILPQPRRSPGGTRKYPREYRGYIDVALALKDLGFRLDEIRPLTRLALGRSVSAGQRETAARLVEDRISELGRQVAVLCQLRDSVRDADAAAAVPAMLRDAVGDAGAAAAVPAALRDPARDAGAAAAVPAPVRPGLTGTAARPADAPQRGWEED